MMRTKTIQVFKFDELKPEVQKKVLSQFRNDLSYDSVTEDLTESFKEQLKEKGLPTDDIRFSLSYSQGDGVAFYGDVDLMAFIKSEGVEKNFELIIPAIEDKNINCNIEKSMNFHHYNHEGTMIVEFDEEEFYSEFEEDDLRYHVEMETRIKPVNAKIEELKQLIASKIRSVSYELKKIGYARISEHESDEAIKETIEINEYEFDETGEIR